MAFGDETRRRLLNLFVGEVSGVQNPANRRKFLILKGEEQMVDEAAVLEAIEKIEKDGLGGEIITALAGEDPAELAAVVEKTSLTEKEKKRVQAAFRILGSDLVKKLMAEDKKKKPYVSGRWGLVIDPHRLEIKKWCTIYD